MGGESDPCRIFDCAEYSVELNDSDMRLADWLKSTKTRRYDFADRICVSPSLVTDYCAGRTWPSSDKMEAIVRETGGQVTANDFLSGEARAVIAEAAA